MLVKLLMSSLYGENIREDNTEKNKCKLEYRMSTEYDERALDYWKLPKSEHVVKLKEIKTGWNVK